MFLGSCFGGDRGDLSVCRERYVETFYKIVKNFALFTLLSEVEK